MQIIPAIIQNGQGSDIDLQLGWPKIRGSQLGLGLFEIEIETEASQVGDEKNLETQKSIQRLADRNYSKVSESKTQ
jgi:hypothetical protein